MFKTRLDGLSQVFHVIQITLAVALYAVFVALLLEFYHTRATFDYDSYAIMGGLLAVALLFTSHGKYVDRLNLLQSSVYSIHEVCFRRIIAVLMLQLIFLFVIKNDTVSRLFLLTYMPVLYVTLFLTYRTLPRQLAKFCYGGDRAFRTLLCGNPNELPNIKHWLDHKSALGFTVVGLLTDENEIVDAKGIPILGKMADLEKVIADHQIAQVLLMHIPESKKDIRNIYHITERCGARLLIFNDLQEIIGHSIEVMQDDGLNFIGIRREPLENLTNRGIKRAMDVALSLVVLVTVFPVLALIVKIFQMLQSPGPLFHKQIREGMQNRRFELIKFRTMNVHSDPLSLQASAGDQRVYPLGRLLRRFSIDEFPQFINVLMGDMSVVGPRPHLPEHNKDFSQVMGHYHVRSFIKPGITGLAQVRGLRGRAQNRGELIGRVVSDLFYIENWSLMLDVIIILRTIVQIFFPPKSAV